jgi:hypothetical protein
MKQDKKSLAVAVIASLSAGAAGAAENPFALKDLDSGYARVAEAAPDQGKAKKEGKCGAEVMKKDPEMKCGASMMKMDPPAPDKKAIEGKCAGMKMDGAKPAAPAAPEAPK